MKKSDSSILWDTIADRMVYVEIEIEVHSNVNEKIKVVGINIAEKATVIWNIANALFGYFKPHEYGLVILPMTVVKRFHDCLVPTHDAVLATCDKVKKLAVIDGFLTKASGYQFYNTSKFNFEKPHSKTHIPNQ